MNLYPIIMVGYGFVWVFGSRVEYSILSIVTIDSEVGYMKYILSFILVLFNFSICFSATYYTTPLASYGFAPSVTSGTSCSTNSNNPQPGFNNALKCLSPGDTLILKDGFYQEAIWKPGLGSDFPSVVSGTPGNPTIIKAEHNRQAVLNPDRNQGFGVTQGWFDFGQHDIVIDGLRFDMSRLPAGNGVGVVGGNVGNIIIQNSEFGNIAGPGTDQGCQAVSLGGVLVSGYSYTTLFKNNYVHDMGYGYNEPHEAVCMGFYMVGSDSIVEGNTFERIGGMCGEMWSFVTMDGQPFTNNRNIIRNNTCNTSGGSGFLFASGSNNRVYNNIVINAGTNQNITRYGIVLSQVGWQVNDSNHILNNTIINGVGSNYPCIGVENDATNARIQNNICWGNTSNGSQNDIIQFHNGIIYSNNLCSSGASTGCSIYTNPLFVGGNDVHLTSNSPVRNIGANLSSFFTTDADGNARPSGTTAWDIGAYQFSSGGNPPPLALPIPTNLQLIQNIP